jgi:hypothetical protein
MAVFDPANGPFEVRAQSTCQAGGWQRLSGWAASVHLAKPVLQWGRANGLSEGAYKVAFIAVSNQGGDLLHAHGACFQQKASLLHS